MRTIDFGQVKDANEYSPVPDGRYPVEIESVEEAANKNGDDVLKLRLRVTDGEHAGAAIFDRLFFTERALPRIKLVLRALGISTKGEVDVTPRLLEGRRCLVDVVVDTYTKSDGTDGRSNAVLFAGYHEAENDESYPPY